MRPAPSLISKLPVLRQESDSGQKVENPNHGTAKMGEVGDVSSRAAGNLEKVQADITDSNPFKFDRHRNKHQVHRHTRKVHRCQRDKPENAT